MQSQLEVCRSELRKLLEEEDFDQKFDQVLSAVQSCQKVDKIVGILVQLNIRKKTALNFATKLFSALGKDKMKLSKIEEFYQQLRNNKMKGQDIDIIRNYNLNGKKNKIYIFLTEKLGTIQGKALFQEYEKQFFLKFSEPLPNSKKLHKNQSGLQIFRYPDNHISEFEKNNAKTLIVLGETGCGKSTFLNSLVNYLAGVEVEDPFRYFIIVQQTVSQMKSITRQISIYYIKDVRTNICYRVIDTPGFGDTSGLNEDQRTIRKIQKLFNDVVLEIHLVLFLMKSSSTRMTPYHAYIFQNVMALFDKSVAQNFVFVLTFADASQSKAIQWLKNKAEGFGDYWDTIKAPKTIEVNNSGFFQKIVPEKDNEMIQNFWKVGTLFLQKLITKAGSISPKSLKITKQLIKQKERLSLRIKDTSEKIQSSLVQQENIRSHIIKILQNEDNMKSNQNFEYQIDVIQIYPEKVDYNVTRCNTCVDSNCHIDCGYGDGEQKKYCNAMDSNFRCTICPLKCSYVNHTNSNQLKKSRSVKKTQTKEDLKRKYYDAKNNMSLYEQSLRNMIKNYQVTVKATKQNIQAMTVLQQKLREISLSKNKPLTTQQYIEFLIDNEKRQKKPGYINRINNYIVTLEQLKIQESTAKGKTYQDLNNRKEEMIKSLMKDVKTKNSSIFEKIRGFFSSQ